MHRRRLRFRPSVARGYSLLEILVVLAIMALLASVVAVSVYHHLERARVETTQQSAQQIRGSVLAYRMQHAGDACPTVDVLVDEQLIDGARAPRDAWDQPFSVACDERGGVVVASAGPDKRLGTSDDVSVPPARPR